MGDPNASIPTPQPVIMRPMFGAQPGAVGLVGVRVRVRVRVGVGVGVRFR